MERCRTALDSSGLTGVQKRKRPVGPKAQGVESGDRSGRAGPGPDRHGFGIDRSTGSSPRGRGTPQSVGVRALRSSAVRRKLALPRSHTPMRACRSSSDSQLHCYVVKHDGRVYVLVTFVVHVAKFRSPGKQYPLILQCCVFGIKFSFARLV